MRRKRNVIGIVIVFLFFVLAGVSQRFMDTSTLGNKQEVKGESLVPVDRVVDGDTIVVDLNGKNETVRFIGIDTPEIAHGNTKAECFGQEAKRKSEEILSGQMVRLENDESQSNRDKYSRLLRYAFLIDGTLVNQLLIEEGFAFEYTYDLPYQYQKEFKEAQTRAREGEKGLWAPSVCN